MVGALPPVGMVAVGAALPTPLSALTVSEKLDARNREVLQPAGMSAGRSEARFAGRSTRVTVPIDRRASDRRHPSPAACVQEDDPGAGSRFVKTLAPAG